MHVLHGAQGHRDDGQEADGPAAQFDHIIVETTGMADPSPVAQTFLADESILPLVRLDGIVTVVDA